MDKHEDMILNAIYSRRSIRRYKEKEVEKEKIIKLLHAGMAAPSACNLQVWEFIVVSEKNVLDKLKSVISQGDYNAPLAMVICANTVNVPWTGDGWVVDCSAAVENMLIAATALELGSVWLGSHNEEEVRNLLHIPEHIHVMNIVYFGYPDEEKTPNTKYTEEAVYWQEYDKERSRIMRTMDDLFKS
ncbi:MAG: putative dehydrogenase/NAD(P)H nitroreductase [Anaerocolumna sp.]|jgi:nitroreductase|nr:putative dehydrogenase/NAD(P)H nitroreductase [Anaerocolumna sp.]